MSMQSHLAELERRHQALEDEITECLTHPAVDDLRIVELKRRKLHVKDEIERLRNGASGTEIAMTCGFSDQSHFSATFRRQIGLTPARYRQTAHTR